MAANDLTLLRRVPLVKLGRARLYLGTLPGLGPAPAEVDLRRFAGTGINIVAPVTERTEWPADTLASFLRYRFQVIGCGWAEGAVPYYRAHEFRDFAVALHSSLHAGLAVILLGVAGDRRPALAAAAILCHAGFTPDEAAAAVAATPAGAGDIKVDGMTFLTRYHTWIHEGAEPRLHPLERA